MKTREKNQLMLYTICDRILDLVDDESIPVYELEAKIERLKKRANKLALSEDNELKETLVLA